MAGLDANNVGHTYYENGKAYVVEYDQKRIKYVWIRAPESDRIEKKCVV